jgi:hypothetical protein
MKKENGTYLIETAGRWVYSTEPGEGRAEAFLIPFEGVVDSVNSLIKKNSVTKMETYR